MTEREKRLYNEKQARRRMGRRALERISETMLKLGVDIDPGHLGTAISMYLEITVHEANQVKEGDYNDPRLYQMARRTARMMQWFADTASEGAAAFNCDIGRE